MLKTRPWSQQDSTELGQTIPSRLLVGESCTIPHQLTSAFNRCAQEQTMRLFLPPPPMVSPYRKPHTCENNNRNTNQHYLVTVYFFTKWTRQAISSCLPGSFAKSWLFVNTQLGTPPFKFVTNSGYCSVPPGIWKVRDDPGGLAQKTWPPNIVASVNFGGSPGNQSSVV